MQLLHTYCWAIVFQSSQTLWSKVWYTFEEDIFLVSYLSFRNRSNLSLSFEFQPITEHFQAHVLHRLDRNHRQRSACRQTHIVGSNKSATREFCGNWAHLFDINSRKLFMCLIWFTNCPLFNSGSWFMLFAFGVPLHFLFSPHRFLGCFVFGFFLCSMVGQPLYQMIKSF